MSIFLHFIDFIKLSQGERNGKYFAMDTRQHFRVLLLLVTPKRFWIEKWSGVTCHDQNVFGIQHSCKTLKWNLCILRCWLHKCSLVKVTWHGSRQDKYFMIVLYSSRVNLNHIVQLTCQCKGKSYRRNIRNCISVF